MAFLLCIVMCSFNKCIFLGKFVLLILFHLHAKVYPILLTYSLLTRTV